MTKLVAKPREVLGKQVKNMRSEGLLPAALYGPEFPSTNVLLDTKSFARVFGEIGFSSLIDLEVEGSGKEKVLIKEVQKNPITDQLLHVSLYVTSKNIKITAEVPLNFVGIAPAEDQNIGFVAKPLDTIVVHCLPADLPSEFEVSIEGLANIGDTLTVADLKLPEGVELDSKMEPTTAIAYVAAPQKVEDLITATPEGEVELDEDGNPIVKEPELDADGNPIAPAEGGEEASE